MSALKIILLFALLGTTFGSVNIVNDFRIELSENSESQNEETEIPKYSLRSIYNKAKSYVPSPSFFIPKISLKNGTLSYDWGLLHMTGSLSRPTEAPKTLSEFTPESSSQLPETTYDYLRSLQANPLISNAIQRSKSIAENVDNQDGSLSSKSIEDYYNEIIHGIIIRQNAEEQLSSSDVSVKPVDTQKGQHQGLPTPEKIHPSQSPESIVSLAKAMISKAEQLLKNIETSTIPPRRDQVQNQPSHDVTNVDARSVLERDPIVPITEFTIDPETPSESDLSPRHIDFDVSSLEETSSASGYLVETLDQPNIRPANFYPLRKSDENQEPAVNNAELRSKPDNEQNKDGILDKIVRNKHVKNQDLDFWKAENYLGQTLGRPLFNYLMDHDMM
ncbi:uncharacterized protein LOC113363600 isoform X1 [Ctenocephalides felis]|uniref:uncharacterized protein LOC113363600 isoform X1 n=1 Tax=Ctenocephalides felis TaxID=7515 RepID=UPI000E6E1DE6|nr:uncharacterized protein LOC113363600 isoform X1 [Ctenocephalides felis]